MGKKITLNASNCFLYAKCQKEWWPAIDTAAKIIHVKKGQPVFKEGDDVTGIYFMIDGIVKVHREWDKERELILRFASKTDILGHRGLSSQSAIYPVSATALTNVTVCFVDMHFFKSSLKVNPVFAYEMLMFFADELMLSEQNLKSLTVTNVKGRLAKLLVTLERKFGTNKEGYISFTISRQDMASSIGTVYETIYRLINELLEEDLIFIEGKSVGIKNKKALIALYA